MQMALPPYTLHECHLSSRPAPPAHAASTPMPDASRSSHTGIHTTGCAQTPRPGCLTKNSHSPRSRRSGAHLYFACSFRVIPRPPRPPPPPRRPPRAPAPVAPFRDTAAATAASLAGVTLDGRCPAARSSRYSRYSCFKYARPPDACMAPWRVIIRCAFRVHPTELHARTRFVSTLDTLIPETAAWRSSAWSSCSNSAISHAETGHDSGHGVAPHAASCSSSSHGRARPSCESRDASQSYRQKGGLQGVTICKRRCACQPCLAHASVELQTGPVHVACEDCKERCAHGEHSSVQRAGASPSPPPVQAHCHTSAAPRHPTAVSMHPQAPRPRPLPLLLQSPPEPLLQQMQQLRK